MKVYYVTKVLQQGVNLKTISPYYILELRKKQHCINCKFI